METSKIINNWLVVFIIWFVALIILHGIRLTQGIVNNGNILTSGKCYRGCNK